MQRTNVEHATEKFAQWHCPGALPPAQGMRGSWAIGHTRVNSIDVASARKASSGYKDVNSRETVNGLARSCNNGCGSTRLLAA